MWLSVWSRMRGGSSARADFVDVAEGGLIGRASRPGVAKGKCAGALDGATCVAHAQGPLKQLAERDQRHDGISGGNEMPRRKRCVVSRLLVPRIARIIRTAEGWVRDDVKGGTMRRAGPQGSGVG